MPSFLKRFSTIAGKNPKSATTQSTPYPKQLQQQPTDHHDMDVRYDLTQELAKRNSMASSQSDMSTDSQSLKTSRSVSLSSISELPKTSQPDVDGNGEKQTQQSSRSVSDHQGQEQCTTAQKPNQMSTFLKFQVLSADNSRPSTALSSAQSSDKKLSRAASSSELNPSQHGPGMIKKRYSKSSLTTFFLTRSRSMPVLQDTPPISQALDADHHLEQFQNNPLSRVSGSKRSNTDLLDQDRRPQSDSYSLNPVVTEPNAPAAPNPLKKLRPKSLIRPKSLTTILFSNEQSLGAQPRLPHHSRLTRWANKGGIGTNEMMVDMETTGVFVSSSVRRLRSEFVYRTVIQCADEIRRRGLQHPNIFNNPSPKKVINAMITLLTDQSRSDLYPIQCLRIDTVAGLLLNLLSQMSNPVIPYTIMEHYFKQGGPNTKSPILPAFSNTDTQPQQESSTTRAKPSPSGEEDPFSDRFTFGASLPPIPALPSKGMVHMSMAWAREYFDLPAFLDILPAMNRVILLEVLHLCQELLKHQAQNHLTITALVQKVSPAIFSTVFDQKMLEEMSGGTIRCSIHGEHLRPDEGIQAENHLFMVILVRFLRLSAMTTAASSEGGGGFTTSCTNVQMMDGDCADSFSEVEESLCGPHGVTSFRKSQARLMHEQQLYYMLLEQSYQEMEIHQGPPQHFGVYGAQLKQQQQEKLKLVTSNNASQDRIVPVVVVTGCGEQDSPGQTVLSQV
ncbi:MAG: hypothetical protein J3Q66DRAFT_388070 [Benniella sp.]|nr:MAG: hypothetical protein J3Q66DRAFT_388070 [Benniella sp.]